MSEHRIPIHIAEEEHDRLAFEFSTLYPDPRNALREYVTNAIDILLEQGARREDSLIKILLMPEDRRIIVSDNGKGMNNAFVESLPGRIANSAKRGRIDQRGEKGIGILAFGSMGHQVHVISKEAGENRYNYLRYEKSNNGRLEAYGSDDPFTREYVDKNFYGSFPHGTKIIVDASPYIMKNDLSEDAVERFIQQTYLPLLKRKDLRLMIGQQGKIPRTINPPTSLDGGLMIDLVNKELQFQVQLSREVKDYSLFAHLVLHPDRDNGKVSVYSKDVKVYESVLGLERKLAKYGFWTCGLISGFINEPNLRIVLGREGVNKTTKAYEGMIELLEKLHAQYWDQIKVTVERSKKQISNKFVTGAWRILERAYQTTKPLNMMPRTPTSQPTSHPPRKPGKKKKGRKFPFACRTEDFGLGEENLRAKLDDSNMGEPIIVVNSGIQDYQTYVIDSKNSKEAFAYILDVATPQMALFEVRDAIRKGASFGDVDRTTNEIVRRAQDLKYASFKRGKKKEGNGEADSSDNDIADDEWN